jgi:hypothetical protein
VRRVGGRGELSESDYMQDLTVDRDIKMGITCIGWEGWTGLTWLWIQTSDQLVNVRAVVKLRGRTSAEKFLSDR